MVKKSWIKYQIENSSCNSREHENDTKLDYKRIYIEKIVILNLVIFLNTCGQNGWKSTT